MTEVSLKLDTFGRAKNYTGVEAVARQLTNLIWMIPGTDPLNPSKGCDIRSYYFNIDKENILSNLELSIKNQISKYTDFGITKVKCKSIINKFGVHLLAVLMQYGIGNQQIVVTTDGERINSTTIKS